MKFVINKTSELIRTSNRDACGVSKNFSTLEQLVNWCKKQDNEVIISISAEPKGKKPTLFLEIYDDYRE